MKTREIKIFYDHDAFYREQKFGGIARCFIELIKHLECEYYLSVKYSINYYIKEIIPNIRDFTKLTFRGKARIRKVINHICTYWNLLFLKYDIIHYTGETLTGSRFVNIPKIITIHDCVPERIFNKGVRSEERLKTMQKVDHIIVVSENTKNDLLYYYPEISSDKITVIYHGFSGFAPSKGCNCWGRYVLSVGMRQSYKNYTNLLRAMSIITKSDNSIKLVSAGKPFSTNELNLIHDLGLENKVICVQCNDSKLADLYKYALAFVYPSFYEGFGIPILEAWSFGTPVALSNTSCFPEIASDAGIYFNPASPEDMANAIRMVINDGALRNSLSSKGLERLKHFTWEKSANEHLKVYQMILTNRR